MDIDETDNGDTGADAEDEDEEMASSRRSSTTKERRERIASALASISTPLTDTNPKGQK